MREPYLFYYKDEVISFEQFLEVCTDENEIKRRRELYTSVLDAQAPLERQWRDTELLATDKFMFEDSTIFGNLVRGTEFYQEILSYRQQLRDYNCREEPRPNRPKTWSE